MLVTGESKAKGLSVLRAALGRYCFQGRGSLLTGGSTSWRVIGEGKIKMQVVEMEDLRNKQPSVETPIVCVVGSGIF